MINLDEFLAEFEKDPRAAWWPLLWRESLTLFSELLTRYRELQVTTQEIEQKYKALRAASER